MDQEIIFEQKDGLGHVTLNRPNALNALTQSMTVLLYKKLKVWAQDPSVCAVVIRGAARDDGRVPFCSGGDIRFLYEQKNDPKKRFAITFYEQEYRLNALIYSFPKPYIALIDGVVMGGGVGVSFHGSHRIMSERAMFAMPETGIGLFPDVGSTYFLPRCPGYMGLYLGLTGTRIGTADALYLGLGTNYISSTRMNECLEALGKINGLELNAEVIEATLRAYSEDPGLSELAERQAVIDRCFSAKTIEDIISNLTAENSEWAEATISKLMGKSPTSLKITFRQLTEFNKLDFESAMKIEYRMAIRCNFSDEFYEGIRAQIIDKDFSPKWSPSRLEDVCQSLVDLYFMTPKSGDMDFD